MMTLDLILALLITAQVFVIFTLINKLNLDRKGKEGREILTNKVKKDYFAKKLNELNIESFENLVKLFIEREGYTNFKKVGKHMYSAEKEKKIFCVKIFKLYCESEIEKFDIRSITTYMSQNNIKNCLFITTNNIAEDAQNLIEKSNETFNIIVIDDSKLLEMAEKINLLPDNSYFYDMVYDEKTKVDKKSVIKNNAFSNKKIVIYIAAALFFFLTSKLMPYNIASLYISYYFVFMTIISSIYCIYMKIHNNSNSGQITE